jgi:catalase
LNNIDFDFAKQIAISVGGTVPEKAARANPGRASLALSQQYYVPKEPTIASRRIAIIIADGFSATDVQAIRAILASAGAVNFVIGPRRGRINSGSGPCEIITTDHHFEGQRSTMFDAVFIPSGVEAAKALASNGRAVHWVREAFGHCKAICAIGEGIPPLYFRNSFANIYL